jgi:hypothetical protein
MLFYPYVALKLQEDITKQVLTIFLMFAYLNCNLACNKIYVTQKPDVKTNDPELFITTNSGRNISFDSQMYKFIDDTIYGMGQEIIDGEPQKSQLVKIAFSDVSSVESIKSHPTAVFFIFGTLLIMGVIAFNTNREM